MRRLLASLFLFAAMTVSALAADCWPSAVSTRQSNCGAVQMFNNVSGQSGAVSAANPLPVTGSFSATSSARATAAAPTYVEGTDNPFSADLGGALRVLATVDTTGLATSANQTTINTTLGTINTTVGTPFQAGGTAIAVGPAATGTALSGAPVRIGLSDGTNAQNWLAGIALGDGVNGNNTGAVAPWVWNGTTWDRMPGTTAGVTVRSPTAANFLVTLPAETTKVIGTVNQGTSPWVVSGAVTNAGTFATQSAITAASGSFASGSQPIGITPTDRTVTSATGASQTVMSALATRKSLLIVNTGNANCGINPTGGTAVIGGAGTLTLTPTGSYSPRIPSLAAITAICTAGQPLYAEES